MSKRKRHSAEQIIKKLRQAKGLLAEGKTLAETAKSLGVFEPTFNRWRNQYSGMKGPEVKRLKELEQENTRLKKLIANQALDINMLKEISKENF